MYGPKGLFMISQDEKLMIFAFPKLMGVIVAPVKRFGWNHRPLPHLRLELRLLAFLSFVRCCLPGPTLFRNPRSGHMPDDFPGRAVIVDFLRLVRLNIFCVALGTLVIAHAVPLVGPFGPAVDVIIQKSHGCSCRWIVEANGALIVLFSTGAFYEAFYVPPHDICAGYALTCLPRKDVARQKGSPGRRPGGKTRSPDSWSYFRLSHTLPTNSPTLKASGHTRSCSSIGLRACPSS